MRVSGANIDRPARWRLGVGAAVVLVLAAAAVSVGIGMARSAASPDEADGAPVTLETGVADATGVAGVDAAPGLYVHVFGEVVNPGLYRLDEGSRVVDVIAAAGGLRDEADEGAVNLARLVSDGEQLRIPAIGEAPPATAAPGDSVGGPTATAERVNLNTADVAALDTLPRVGPAIAARIIEWREANGRFTSVDDLLAVPGIGDKMLATLRELVTV